MEFFQTLYKFKLPLALAILGIVFIGLGFVSPSLNQNKHKDIVVENRSSPASENKIKVDVSGAVRNPGVYSLNNDSRVLDAVSAAGGFNNSADQDWLAKQINLASKLIDGQKVYFQKVGENNDALNYSTEIKGKININRASASDLDTLPGIGMVTANKIISSRPFQDPQDLLTKKIVGNSTFEKIKDLISVY